uniref:Peroxisomal membrane protein 11B n=1 Tax=Echinococcus granulosus TaxID=6210 RepID=A0A068X550_ECHGR|nr:hypothetical protein EgrG_002056600 [Echinococcus granulosus]
MFDLPEGRRDCEMLNAVDFQNALLVGERLRGRRYPGRDRPKYFLGVPSLVEHVTSATGVKSRCSCLIDHWAPCLFSATATYAISVAHSSFCAPKEYHGVLSSSSRLALLSSCPMSGWQRTCGAFLQEEKNREHSSPLRVMKTYKRKPGVRLFAESLSTFGGTFDQRAQLAGLYFSLDRGSHLEDVIQRHLAASIRVLGGLLFSAVNRVFYDFLLDLTPLDFRFGSKDDQLTLKDACHSVVSLVLTIFRSYWLTSFWQLSRYSRQGGSGEWSLRRWRKAVAMDAVVTCEGRCRSGSHPEDCATVARTVYGRPLAVVLGMVDLVLV